jgi:hypothetical protein
MSFLEMAMDTQKFSFKKLINDCLTEGDGTSYCAMRVAFFIAFFAYMAGVNVAIALDIYNTLHPVVPPIPPNFSIMNSASGISIILTAGGAAVALKGVNGNAIPPSQTGATGP